MYGYDDVGNLVMSAWNGTTISYEYDARDRVVQGAFDISGSVYLVDYGYDNASNLVTLTYNGSNTLTYQYDALNRISSAGDWASFTYKVNDHVDTITYGNGVETVYSYDIRGRLTGIVTSNGVGTLLNLSYVYDYSGSITEICNGTFTETYSYDLLDRLNGSTGPWGTINYSYDMVGNRLRLTAGGVTSYSYNCMNRLVSVGSDDYSWDANGNLIEKEDGADTWSYLFDPENRLTSVLLNNTVQNRFWYDAGGRRVWLDDVQSGNVTFVYSGLNVVYELVNKSSSTLHFYANGLHIAENRSGTVEYFHQDHLGSTRLKTNSTGDIVYDTNYMPFGPDQNETGSEGFKYTGKQEDSSGLYYYGARYYDPETGRFITEDTFHGYLDYPLSQNYYGYCMNNPLKYTDPDGHSGVAIGGLGFLAGIIEGIGIGAGIAIGGLVGIVIIGYIGYQMIQTNTGVYTPPPESSMDTDTSLDTGYIEIEDELELLNEGLVNSVPPAPNRRKYKGSFLDSDTGLSYDKYSDPTRSDVTYHNYKEGSYEVWESHLVKEDGGVSSIRKTYDQNGLVMVEHRYTNAQGVVTDKWHQKYVRP